MNLRFIGYRKAYPDMIVNKYKSYIIARILGYSGPKNADAFLSQEESKLPKLLNILKEWMDYGPHPHFSRFTIP